MSELADYQFKIEHKKEAENNLAVALSRLNRPNDDEENMEYVEKIINSVGLEFDPDMEILEFGEMIGTTETVEEEKEQDPLELNSFEFFAQALSYFEREARGQLSSGEQSPASPVASLNSRIEINAIKTIILQENFENKQREDSTITPERSSDPSLEETSYTNTIEVNNYIIGTNSSLTSEYQMSDPNLKWLKPIIMSKETIKEILRLDKKGPSTNIKRKLLKHMPNLQIIKDLIYLVDEDKFKNKRCIYLKHIEMKSS